MQDRMGEVAVVEIDLLPPGCGDLHVASPHGGPLLVGVSEDEAVDLALRSAAAHQGLEAVVGELVLGRDDLDGAVVGGSGRVVDDEVLGLHPLAEHLTDALLGGGEAEVCALEADPRRRDRAAEGEGGQRRASILAEANERLGASDEASVGEPGQPRERPERGQHVVATEAKVAARDRHPLVVDRAREVAEERIVGVDDGVGVQPPQPDHDAERHLQQRQQQGSAARLHPRGGEHPTHRSERRREQRAHPVEEQSAEGITAALPESSEQRHADHDCMEDPELAQHRRAERPP